MELGVSAAVIILIPIGRYHTISLWYCGSDGGSKWYVRRDHYQDPELRRGEVAQVQIWTRLSPVVLETQARLYDALWRQRWSSGNRYERYLRRTFREHPRRKRRAIQCIVLSAVFLCNAVAQQSANPPAGPFEPDAPGGSHAESDLRVFGTNSDGWLYPITRLNESLPRWIQFGGQFRDRVESADGIGYAPVNDVTI